MKEIEIVTVKDEHKISTPEIPIDLDKYLDINTEIAWELANLIRIAGTDYQCFNNWFNNKEGCREFTLENKEERQLEGIESNNNWIYAEKIINRTTLRKYTLLNEEDLKNKDLIANFPDDIYYKYRILKTYEYVSYYPVKLDVDIDRFGFIVEREEEGQKNIFVVFRGTRELAEWFSNAQFKQVNFLETEDNRQGIEGFGKISLGFNKMYTQFRPGLLIEQESINEISRIIDAKLRKFIERVDKFKIKEQSIYQAISEFFSSKYLDKTNANIYITGHSLGGALATIATMNITLIDLEQDEIKNPIHLYTFASPRVGDNIFADKFNAFISKDKIKCFRFANSEDIVPKVPFPVWFKSGLNLDQKPILELTRSTFNKVTGGIFDKDYQHVGVPIYFTHQACRFDDENNKKSTATIGDNHNMTSTYCGALEKRELWSSSNSSSEETDGNSKSSRT